MNFNKYIRNFLPIIAVFQHIPYAHSMTDEQVADSLIARALAAQATGDMTQSEAQLTIPKVQKDVKETFGELAENKNNLDVVFNRERQYKDDYYVLYTGMVNAHLNQDVARHLFEDITRKLYKRTEGKIGALQNKAFQFVRYTYNNPLYSKYTNIIDFFNKWFTKYGIIRDIDSPEIMSLLISTNLAVFGQSDWPGECTWKYYTEPKRIVESEIARMFLEESIKSFDYTTKYVDELIDLMKLLQNGGYKADLMQIFIPKNIINLIAYKAWRAGVPFDATLLPEMFGEELKKSNFKWNAGIDKNLKVFKKRWEAGDAKVREQSSQMLKNAISGKYFLNPYLDDYMKAAVPYMNNTEGRILVTNDYMLNPLSGILIFRYYTVDPAVETEYKQKLKTIISKMQAEKEVVSEQEPTRPPITKWQPGGFWERTGSVIPH